MPELDEIAVLEWNAWGGFLLQWILRDCARSVPVNPFERLPDLEFERICASSSVVCFHINLSVRRNLPFGIEDLTRRFTERGLHVVNGLVRDIRKSALHAHIQAIGLPSPRAARSGSPDEEVFIKTNLNFGGEKEKTIPPEMLQALGMEKYISPEMEAYTYRLTRRGAVSDAEWENPALVVERYVTNAEGSFYRIYFSGKQVIIVKAFSPGIIKKMSEDERDTNYVSELDFLKDGSDGLPISPALKRDVATFIEKTPIEFGCLDIVHDGNDNHFIIDLNLTPAGGRGQPAGQLNEFLLAGMTHAAQRKPPAPLGTPLVEEICDER